MSRVYPMDNQAGERLIVIGGASLDVLHFAGRTQRSAGGAGLYTSLAAQREGAQVTMVAPRPRPVPPELAPALQRLDWRGPEVPPEDLPSFEIAHDGRGASEMRSARWRAEARLSPSALPVDLPDGWAYCIPLDDPILELAFLRHFKTEGRRTACGTFACAIDRQPEVVRQILAEADVFFCNEREAEGLFGSLDAARTEAGKLLFITRGARGARVLQGDQPTDVAGIAVEELDPTGAGDTFCGTVLAWLARGEHPVRAARRAVVVAAQMVTGVGPERLLAPPPPAGARDPRLRVDPQRVEAVAAVLKDLGEVESFDFVGEPFPRVGHPGALDFFFAATLQQFGFWTEQGGRYREPMMAELDGQRLKGSDFLWAAYHRWLVEDPQGLTPAGQAELTRDRLDWRLRADDGCSPLPATELHLQQARAYGRDLLGLGWSPEIILERVHGSSRPLAAFLTSMDRVGGYKEDPLRKKSALLAVILQARPERFLQSRDGEDVSPIIDYHLQRSCLRIGLVRVEQEDLRRRLEQRRRLDAESEWAVREACFEALAELRRASGRSMAALDWFFFQNRSRCPEMTEPDCAACPLDAVCARRKELFQPVFRTAWY